MNTFDVAQRTPEWFAARCGSLGASVVHEALAKTKTGWSASRASRMATLVIERLTGNPVETYQNAAMLTGIEREPEARSAYEFLTGNDVQEIGLIRHPSIAGTHASPDGLIGDDGLLEVKCPQPAQHMALLLGEAIPAKWTTQIYWQLACSGRAYGDFVSFNPDFPLSMQLFIKRVPRDDVMIADMEAEVRAFLAEVDEKVAALTAKFERKAA